MIVEVESPLIGQISAILDFATVIIAVRMHHLSIELLGRSPT
ncbi:MAG: hypothetical protein ACXQTB_00480 [Candidatus Nezhaarchaeales archaeon]